MTQVQFGERLGRSKRSIQEWESGRTEPSERVIRLIEKVFSVNPEWLREGKGEMFLKRNELKFLDVAPADFVLMPVPVVSRVRAGRGLYPAISAPSELKMAWVPRKKAHHRVFFFRVEGDSMRPRLQPGDWVLADLDSSVMNGDIAVVELTKESDDEGELLLKKFYKKKDVIVLESYNPDYHPVIVKPEDIKTLAKVITIVPNGE